MSVTKEIKDQLKDCDAKWSRHSMNQKAMLRVYHGERRFYRVETSKSAKAQRRRDSAEVFLAQFHRKQFQRSLEHMIAGTATPEDIGYVERHIEEFEKPLGRIDHHVVTRIDLIE